MLSSSPYTAVLRLRTAPQSRSLHARYKEVRPSTRDEYITGLPLVLDQMIDIAAKSHLGDRARSVKFSSDGRKAVQFAASMTALLTAFPLLRKLSIQTLLVLKMPCAPSSTPLPPSEHLTKLDLNIDGGAMCDHVVGQLVSACPQLQHLYIRSGFYGLPLFDAPLIPVRHLTVIWDLDNDNSDNGWHRFFGHSILRPAKLAIVPVQGDVYDWDDAEDSMSTPQALLNSTYGSLIKSPLLSTLRHLCLLPGPRVSRNLDAHMQDLQTFQAKLQLGTELYVEVKSHR